MNETSAHSRVAREPGTSRGAVWFGAAGGGVAWTSHLMLAYLVSEFGCVAGLGELTFLNVTAVAWSILAVSAAALACAIAAAVVAGRVKSRLGARIDQDPGSAGAIGDLTGTASVLNVLFTLIIAGQTLPILFYLGHC